MSGDRSGPHFTLVASTRRQFTDAQKRAIIADVEAGGSVSEVSRRHNIHASLLFRWRSEYRNRKPVTPKQVRTATFLPMAVGAAQTPTEKEHASLAEPTLIDVELANGRRIRISDGVDVQALMRIIVALETNA